MRRETAGARRRWPHSEAAMQRVSTCTRRRPAVADGAPVDGQVRTGLGSTRERIQECGEVRTWRRSDPKSEGADSSESTQAIAAEGACFDPNRSDQERLGVLLGVPQHLDPELEFLIVLVGAHRHVRITIRTILP